MVKVGGENKNDDRVKFNNIKELKDFLIANYPVRKSQRERKKFRKWLTGYVDKQNKDSEIKYAYEEDKYSNKGSNIIVGGLDKADIILTAHYDTPANLLFPTKIFKNPIKFFCFTLVIPALIWLFLMIKDYFINDKISTSTMGVLIIFLVNLLYFSIFLFENYVYGVANKKNENDNTSGVLTLLTIMKNIPLDERSKVCFVFFDQEESYLLKNKRGSTALKSNYAIQDKLLINFDCVGDGDTIYFITDEEKFIDINEGESPITDMYNKLKGRMDENSKYEFGTTKNYTFNSDHKSFPENSIGVKVAMENEFSYGKWRYHTCWDMNLDEKNIEMLSGLMIDFIGQIEKNNDNS